MSLHSHLPACAAAAESLQSCPTLCDPIDGSPLGSPVPGILQARTLERVAISFSNAWKWKVKVKSLSHIQLCATPWTAAYQGPLPMDFPGKSTGVGRHCLLQGDGKGTPKVNSAGNCFQTTSYQKPRLLLLIRTSHPGQLPAPFQWLFCLLFQ